MSLANSPDDAPLGQQFYQDPLLYVQSFIHNLNNQLFLSQFQLNNLHALLLMAKTAPWDELKPNNVNCKEQINQIVDHKVREVKNVLENLSSLYEEKVKQSTLSQIQKLMSIMRCKSKSVFISKIRKEMPCSCNHQNKQKEHKDNKNSLNNDQEIQHKNQISNDNQNNNEVKNEIYNNNQKQQQLKQSNNNNAIESNNNQVLSLFYGLSNISNLSSLALTNFLQYNASERCFKFRMGSNYIMAVKNNDPISFDLTSSVSNLSQDLFVHGVFPFLCANQLFHVRGVCKQWLSYVKQAWHGTFKRQMFIQLLACQFCKDIQFYYKLIHLRNPFFQKLSVLLHALIQIIQWDKIYLNIINNTITEQMKKSLIILLKMSGENILINNINQINQTMWLQYKTAILDVKNKVTTMLHDLNSSNLSNNQLKILKCHLLDHPFLRVDDVNSDDKSPLLIMIFMKQLLLQQMLRNHIFFSQQYLLNNKKRLDQISKKMPQHRGFLEGVYKVLLLKPVSTDLIEQKQQGQCNNKLLNLQDILQFIFKGTQTNQPDFVIRNKKSQTNIFLDEDTKLDIIMMTVKEINSNIQTQQKEQDIQVKSQQISEKSQIKQQQVHKEQKNSVEIDQNIKQHQKEEQKVIIKKQLQQQ